MLRNWQSWVDAQIADPAERVEAEHRDLRRLEIRAMRSALIQSSINTVTGWSRVRPMAANEMPVLPLVASAMGSLGEICPVS